MTLGHDSRPHRSRKHQALRSFETDAVAACTVLHTFACTVYCCYCALYTISTDIWHLVCWASECVGVRDARINVDIQPLEDYSHACFLWWANGASDGVAATRTYSGGLMSSIFSSAVGDERVLNFTLHRTRSPFQHTYIYRRAGGR